VAHDQKELDMVKQFRWKLFSAVFPLGLMGLILTGCHTIRPSEMSNNAFSRPGENSTSNPSGAFAAIGTPQTVVRAQGTMKSPQDLQLVQATQGAEEKLPNPRPDPSGIQPPAFPGNEAFPPHDPLDYPPLPPGAGDPGPLPTELAPVAHPTYRVAPADILLIDAQPFLPKPPYRIQALDELIVQVAETLPNQPIAAKYRVSPEGTINLGFSYGSVRVGGLTVDQTQEAIREHLAKILKNPQVAVALESFRGIPQVRGEHLVRPDGTISLGMYGCVFVNGLTLGQIECVVEKHLSRWVLDPQVSVDVFAYNSQKYYVIVDGGGYGQFVKAFPSMGYENVLDAIEKIGGLPAVSSKRKIWVARPTPANHHCTQILPVDWNAITQGGSTPTNYQIFPGDRIYVRADPFIEADNWLAKVLAPVERVLGITLLGTSVANSFRSGGGGNTGFVVTTP
jgi:polysaccharide export outer membrane protein